jgi:branched-chain amino acid transport system substrate-binding protein
MQGEVVLREEFAFTKGNRLNSYISLGGILMKKQPRSLKPSIFTHKAAWLGLLAPILIMICAMLSCDQAELVSNPSGETGVTLQQMQLPPGSPPNANPLQTLSSFSSMKTRSELTGASQLSEPLEDRVIKVGMIVEAGLPSGVSARYGAQLAMYEINQSGGVLGIPIELLTDGETTQHVVSDDVYGPRIGGDDGDGEVYGPPTPGDPGEIMGGILGFPIGLVFRDNEDDSMLSAELVEELISQDGVVAIIGPDYSRNALKAAPVAQSYRVPMVATGATNPDITKAGEYVFMAAFADTFQGEVMARFARESLRAHTAALLTQEGDPYTEGLSRFFEESFIELGGDIVTKQTYPKPRDPSRTRGVEEIDFTSQLKAIASEEPDVVFMSGFVPEVPQAIKQARTIPQGNTSGITATFLGGDSWEDPDLITIAGDAVEGCYFSTSFSPDTPDESGHDFVRSYQSMFGMTPDSNSAIGYDAFKLVATAIRRAGSVDKEAIRDQLAATSGYSGATYIERYDQDRHPIKGAVIMKIENGQFEFHQYVEP